MLRRVSAFFLLSLAAAAPARADEAFRIYHARGVRAIFDITNSGVGLAVQDLARARDRIVIFDSASSLPLHRQGLLAERNPVERRQLVERGRPDASPYQRQAHHRRL